MKLTHLQIIHRFNYDPETGILTNRTHRNKSRIGAAVGYVNTISHSSGYSYQNLITRINGKTYAVAKIIYYWMTGTWPKEIVDHINGNSLDNRWLNLRACKTSRDNRNNVPGRAVSGHKGITYLKPSPKRPNPVWRANIFHQGRNIYLGYFDTFEKAVDAYRAKAIELKGEFVNFSQSSKFPPGAPGVSSAAEEKVPSK